MSTVFIIKFKVKSEKLADFHHIMEGIKSELPEAKGCRGVIVHRNTEDASSYLVVETWESKELHEKYAEGLVSSGGWDNIVGHLQEAPIGDYFDVT